MWHGHSIKAFSPVVSTTCVLFYSFLLIRIVLGREKINWFWCFRLYTYFFLRKFINEQRIQKAFSEYLNFKSRKTYLQTVEDFDFENIREKPRKCSNTNPQVLKQRVKGIREQNESLRKKVHFFKEYILIFCIRTSHNYDIFQCFHYKEMLYELCTPLV